jgi:hypothetical protein
MTRRGLRGRPVGPELSEDTVEVTAKHDVRLVRLAGYRVLRVPVAVVRTERVVAECPGTDVDRHAVGRIELTAVSDDLDGGLLELVVYLELRRVPRVDRRALCGTRECKRADLAPVRPDETLHVAGDREAVLRHELRERERLPEVRIGHRGA